MIFYGTRSKQLIKEAIPANCPNCGTMNSLELYVFQKYAHVYRLPVFPLGKTGVSQCDHCKQVLEKKQMPPQLLAEYDTLKAKTKTPFWMYTGASLFVVLIVIALFANQQRIKENAQWILAPQSGDVYEYKTSEGQYTLLMVNDVQGDTVFVRQNQYEVNLRKGLRKLKEKGSAAYESELYAFSKKELKEMLDKEEILDIDRK